MRIEEWMRRYRAKPRESLYCKRCKVYWDKEMSNGKCPKCEMQLTGVKR